MVSTFPLLQYVAESTHRIFNYRRMLSVVLRFLNVICKNNNSDKDSFSYEYIMIVVTSSTSMKIWEN